MLQIGRFASKPSPPFSAVIAGGAVRKILQSGEKRENRQKPLNALSLNFMTKKAQGKTQKKPGAINRIRA